MRIIITAAITGYRWAPGRLGDAGDHPVKVGAKEATDDAADRLA